MAGRKQPGKDRESESIRVRNETLFTLDRLSYVLGIPRTELLARLVEWFARQPETTQDGLVRRREVPPENQAE